MSGPSKTRVLALWSAWDIVKYDAPAFGDPLTSQERPEERQGTSPGAPQDALRSSQGHLLGRLGMLWERSRPPKRRPEGPGELPKGAQERESGAQVELKSIARAEKVDFVKSAPRLGPADAPGTSDPSKVSLNQQKYSQIHGFAHASRTSGVQKHVS